MKSYYLYIFILAFAVTSCKTVYLEGTTTQGAGGLANEYPTKVVLKKRLNRVKGTNWFCLPNDTATYVKMSFTGKVKGKTMYITEDKIIDSIPIFGQWLTKDIELQYISKKPLHLKGTWKAHQNEYAKGKILIKEMK